MWWADNAGQRGDKRFDNGDDDRYQGESRNKQLTDVSLTTGVIDQFIMGDFINIGITGPFSGNGRTSTAAATIRAKPIRWISLSKPTTDPKGRRRTTERRRQILLHTQRISGSTSRVGRSARHRYPH